MIHLYDHYCFNLNDKKIQILSFCYGQTMHIVFSVLRKTTVTAILRDEFLKC